MTARKGRIQGEAAVVCPHVAEGRPVRLATRDTPLEAADSGWQFLCGELPEEDPNKARIWAVDEVLEQEPSLRQYVNLPPGTTLMRKGAGEQWVVGRGEQQPS